MLRLVVVCLVGALIWMGWWVFGHTAYQRGLQAWVEDRRGEGWAADYSDLSTRGFPNRFDTTITDVALADPETGVAWSAPFVQFLSLAYKPHQVIAVLPDTHVFSTPFQTIDITHEDARASLFLQASAQLGLDSARIVAMDLKATSSRGPQLTLDEGRLAAEALEDQDNTYRIGAELVGLFPTKEALRALDPGGVLPERIERLRADVVMQFTATWDRTAIETARPQLTNIDLSDLSARWGNVTFRAAGALSVDDQGIPEGRITIRAEEWRRILDMAEAVGMVPGPLRGTIEAALRLLAGNGDVLDAPLGIIPLGDAPRLVIR
ncbi:DUF2125 domain-containing protein [Rhodobacteraceae bacterium]|nr:DUF2125 domain-containing protein [Paracoccaceae bacterium]